jgi:AraC-like DNA-binding protein
VAAVTGSLPELATPPSAVLQRDSSVDHTGPVVHALVTSAWVSCGCATTVLPDGCVDVVWLHGDLVVAGPTTAAVQVPPSGQERPFGVRLRTGAAEAALGVPANVLRDLHVPLAEVYGSNVGLRVQDRVARAQGSDTRAGLQALMKQVAGLAVAEQPDLLVHEAARRLAGPHALLPQVARDLDISERQLRRRFERSVGYGPRMLGRVRRLQQALARHERAPGMALAELASAAGYADQAHLSREVRQLSGMTPRQLLACGARAAGERAETFKTCTRGDHRIVA